MAVEPVTTLVAAADASNASTTAGFFRKILRTSRLALRRFSAWRKAELLAVATAKSIKANKRYIRLALPPPPTLEPQATPPTASAISAALLALESHDLQMESRPTEHTTTSSPCTQPIAWNTSPPTPAAFVQPTCPLRELPTFAGNTSTIRLPQPSQSSEIGGKTTPLAARNYTPYETHFMLASGIVIGIFLLRLVLTAAQHLPLARDRAEDVANEQHGADWEQLSSVGSPRSSVAGDEQRSDVFYGPFDDPLTRYAVPRPPTVLVTHRPHYVVLEAEAGSPVSPSESEGTAYEPLAGQLPDGPGPTSCASTTDAYSDTSGSPAESPVFSLPSAYSQDSIPTGEDTAVTTPDDVPRPLELPQDPLLRELFLNVTWILNSLRNDPPSLLPFSNDTPHSKETTDTEAQTVRAMLYDPRDCDVVLGYLRRRHTGTDQASDDVEGACAEGEGGDLAEYEAALARIRCRRAEMVSDIDGAMGIEKPDISAVRHMSQCFRETVAAGTAPYGKGTKEEIWEWLSKEERERRVARRSARRIDLGVSRKPDLREILTLHTGLDGMLDLLTRGTGQMQQPQVTCDEEIEETAVAGDATEAYLADWAADEIMVPDEDVATKIERGGPAIRNPRRTARGGKVRAPARRAYLPRDRSTAVLCQPRDLPNLGDVTAVVHVTMQEEVAYETEFRHAHRLLEKIEAQRRRAALKARAMQYARVLDERGRPLAGSSRIDATIVDEETDHAETDLIGSCFSLSSPFKVGGELRESVHPTQHETIFKGDNPVANGSQVDVPPSPPMEAEDIEQLHVLAMLRASRPKRR